MSTSSALIDDDDLPDDPELRQLIAESAWGSIDNDNDNDDENSSNDDEQEGKTSNAKKTSKKIVKASSSTNNNRHTKNESNTSDNMWDLVMKSFDLHEDQQKHHHHHHSENSTTTSTTNNFSSALGIRKDSTTGKTIMHIDPTGVFFGGGTATQDEENEDENNQTTSKSSFLLDARTRKILAEEANALSNSDAEAFDYEMTGDDLAFYEELKTLVDVREELLRTSTEDNNNKNSHQNVKTAESTSIPAKEEHLPEKPESQDEDDDENELEAFLRQTRDKNSELYEKFVVEKKKKENQEDQEKEEEKQQSLKQSSRGVRRTTAAAELRKQKHQQQNSTKKKSSSSSSSSSSMMMPPQVAKLLKEIIQEMDQDEEEEHENENENENDSETQKNNLLPVEDVLSTEEQEQRKKRDQEMKELKAKTRELVLTLKKTKKEQRKEDKKRIQEQQEEGERSKTNTKNTEEREKNRIEKIEREILLLASTAVRNNDKENKQEEEDKHENETTTTELDLLENFNKHRQELASLTNEIDETVTNMEDDDDNDDTKIEEPEKQNDIEEEQSTLQTRIHNNNFFSSSSTSMERLTSVVLEPLAQSTLFAREIQQHQQDSDTMIQNMITDIRKDVVNQQLKRLMKMNANQSKSTSSSSKSTDNKVGITDDDTKNIVEERNIRENNLIEENERKIAMLLQQRHNQHQHEQEGKLSTNRTKASAAIDRLLLLDEDENEHNREEQPLVTVTDDVSLFPRPPSAPAATNSNTNSNKLKNLNDKQQQQKEKLKQNKLNARKLFQQRREVEERTKMAEIDQILHRELWTRERDEKEFQESSKILFSNENQSRMAIRSEESMRIHDLRTRELRQRTIVTEWQSHQKNMKQEQQRNEIVVDNEPGLRQKIRDMESVSWAELSSGFTEQRDLIVKEETEKREQKLREEREKKAKEEEELRISWDKMKSDIAIAEMHRHQQDQTEHQAQNENEHSNYNFAKLLIGTLKKSIASIEKKQDKITFTNRSSVSPPPLRSIPLNPPKPSSFVSLGIDTERFLSQKVSFSSSFNNNHSSYLPISTTSSDNLLLLLSPQVTSKGMMTMSITSTSSSSDESTLLQGLPSAKLLSQMTQSFNYLRHLEKRLHQNDKKSPERQKLEDEIQTLTSIGASRTCLETAKRLHDQVNVIDLSTRKKENERNNNTKFAVAIPSLKSLEKRFRSLLSVDVEGNHGLRCIDSTTTSSGNKKAGEENWFGDEDDDDDRKDEEKSSPSSHIRHLNVNDCKLTSLKPFFSSSSSSSTTISNLVILTASKNLLSASPFLFSSSATSSFITFPHLTVLNLSKNKIESLSSKEFCSENFPSLQDLDLSDNLLKTLPLSIFTSLIKLRRLNVSQNYFGCDGLISSNDAELVTAAAGISSSSSKHSSNSSMMMCLPFLEHLDVSDQKSGDEFKSILPRKIGKIEIIETKQNHQLHHQNNNDNSPLQLVLPCLKTLDISFNTSLDDLSGLKIPFLEPEFFESISSGITHAKVIELKKQLVSLLNEEQNYDTGAISDFFTFVSGSIPPLSSSSSQITTSTTTTTTTSHCSHLLDVMRSSSNFNNFFSSTFVPQFMTMTMNCSSLSENKKESLSLFTNPSQLYYIVADGENNNNNNKRTSTSNSNKKQQKMPTTATILSSSDHFYRARLSASAITISSWFRRTVSIKALMEKAQRKIAPVWRGGWVRLRLRKRFKNKLNNDDDDEFNIPEGVNEDDFLNDASEKAGKAKKDVSELLRKRLMELENGEDDVEKNPHQVSTNSSNNNKKIPTPPPTNQSNFMMRRVNNNTNNNNKSRLLFDVNRNDEDNNNFSSARPFSPFPPSSNNNNNNNRAVTPSSSHAAVVSQQQKERASSATVISSQQQQQKQNNDSEDNNNNDGWSAAITDLLKFRDRKRKAAQSARARQEKLQGGGLGKKI